jgi:hypothetical protein
VDHIDYQVSPKVERKFMLEALRRFGSTAIPMHLALFNIPLKIAARFDIPLVIWGENSAFEYGNANDECTGFKLDSKWLKSHGVTHGTTAADWIGENLSAKELTPYYGPEPDELERMGVLAVFLGYYLPWDVQKSYEAAKAHGFQGASDGARTGIYDFADIDDNFISIHHYLKWYKFGFPRTFDNLSLEIRNGRLSRDKAIAVAREFGECRPDKDIALFCDYVGITPQEFFEIIEPFRNTNIWYREDSQWKIRDFLIPDWNWDRH